MPEDPEIALQAKPTRPRTPPLPRARRVAILKALADPHRFELLQRIARCESDVTCSDAGAALGISPATLSHHIKELHAAGLIEIRREGKFSYLSVRPGVLAALIDTLSALHCPGQTPQS